MRFCSAVYCRCGHFWAEQKLGRYKWLFPSVCLSVCLFLLAYIEVSRFHSAIPPWGNFYVALDISFYIFHYWLVTLELSLLIKPLTKKIPGLNVQLLISSTDQSSIPLLLSYQRYLRVLNSIYILRLKIYSLSQNRCWSWLIPRSWTQSQNWESENFRYICQSI